MLKTPCLLQKPKHPCETEKARYWNALATALYKHLVVLVASGMHPSRFLSHNAFHNSGKSNQIMNEYYADWSKHSNVYHQTNRRETAVRKEKTYNISSVTMLSGNLFHRRGVLFSLEGGHKFVHHQSKKATLQHPRFNDTNVFIPSHFKHTFHNPSYIELYVLHVVHKSSKRFKSTLQGKILSVLTICDHPPISLLWIL